MSSGPRETGGDRYLLSTTFDAMLRLGASPVPSRSSGTCATPAEIAARGSPDRSAAAGDANDARAESPHAVDRLRQLALAVARHTGNADDLAGADVERDAVDGKTAAVARDRRRLEPRARRRRVCARALDPTGLGDLAPDHQRRERARRGVCAGHGRDVAARREGP